MANRFKERTLATIKLLIKVMPAALLSTFLSMLLVRCTGEYAASKILGADNSDIRSLYYHTIAKVDEDKDSYDKLVLYNPITNLPNRDRITQLADELRNVCKYHPSIIVFDYILADTASYSLSSSFQIVDAIQACLDSGIIFIAAEEKYTDTYLNKAIHNSSFFVKPPYSLKVERGNTATIFNKALDKTSDDDILWMPLVVSSQLNESQPHPASFYSQRYLSFAPGQIETAFNGHPEDYLRKKISSKIVIFSSHTAADDIHELPFPVKTIPDGDIDYSIQISGAEMLWYSIRDEIYDKWDRKAPRIVVFIITLLLTCLYCLLRRMCACTSVDSLLTRIKNSFCSFLLFIIVIALLLILCFFMMSRHIVFPITVTTVSLVFVNLLEPLWVKEN